jgi:hypothetical protein
MSKNPKILKIYELESRWKEEAVALFEVLIPTFY